MPDVAMANTVTMFGFGIGIMKMKSQCYINFMTSATLWHVKLLKKTD